MRLTPLAFRLNAFNAAIPEKKSINKKIWISRSVKNEKLIVNQFFWQRITRLLDHISSKVWENCRGLEFGPECGGTGTVIELAMAKQDYKKVDHITTWLIGVLQKFWQFYPESLSQNTFSSFLSGCKFQVQLFHLGPLCSTGLFHEGRE